MLHQFSQWNLVGIASFFLNFCMRIVLLFFRIGLGIVRIFSSALYPPSSFSHLRFILHPHFLIRVLSSIRIFSSVFSHPPSVSAIRIRIRIRVLSLPALDLARSEVYQRLLINVMLLNSGHIIFELQFLTLNTRIRGRCSKNRTILVFDFAAIIRHVEFWI